MRLLLQRFCLCALAVALCAGFAAGADLEAAKRAYEQKDFAGAFKESTPLAEQGNADAQLILGKMYMRGQGVLKDTEEAIKWLKASGEQGNSDAQFFLGTIYLLPHKDIAQGIMWIRLSAEQGNQDAQLVLGQGYAQGLHGLPRDPVQADMWLRLAAKDNLPFYQAQLEAAERRMGPYQIAKGRVLADAWEPKHGLRPDDKPDPASANNANSHKEKHE